MNLINKKVGQLVNMALVILLVSGFSSEFTRRVDPLPNMPKGNPDLNLGIVVHPNSTGVDVLRDSSQNIRFVASKNLDENAIETLRSSSMVDRTPKKFKFIDKKHGISSDYTYEFTISFNYKNDKWKSINFMPFPSVIEWVTEEKLLHYAKQWDKIFMDAGWTRAEYKDSDDPRRVQNFKVPTLEYNVGTQYCSWTTKDYKAVMEVRLRDRKQYEQFVSKVELKKVKEYPDGYVAFIIITKKSQYE